MSEHHLVLDALIQPVHMSNILKVTREHPNLKVVIDHGAKPIINPADMPSWKDLMTQLAQETASQQVMCKLSGLWTEAPKGSLIDTVAPAPIVYVPEPPTPPIDTILELLILS
jgi:L-fuconolactonase